MVLGFYRGVKQEHSWIGSKQCFRWNVFSQIAFLQRHGHHNLVIFTGYRELVLRYANCAKTVTHKKGLHL